MIAVRTLIGRVGRVSADFADGQVSLAKAVGGFRGGLGHERKLTNLLATLTCAGTMGSKGTSGKLRLGRKEVAGASRFPKDSTADTGMMP